MTPEVISAIAAGIVTILGAFFGFTRYILDKFLKELKPNGGSSIKDQVTRLEEKFKNMEKHQEKIDEKLDKVYDLVLKQFGSK
jgi:septation ring formation regulator EzrA